MTRATVRYLIAIIGGLVCAFVAAAVHSYDEPHTTWQGRLTAAAAGYLIGGVGTWLGVWLVNHADERQEAVVEMTNPDPQPDRAWTEPDLSYTLHFVTPRKQPKTLAGLAQSLGFMRDPE